MHPAAAEASESHRVRALAAELRERVLFRDEALLVLDKPPGLAAQVSSTFMEEFSGECTYAYRIYQYILGTILGIVQGWPRRAAAAWACRWTPRCRCCASGPRSAPGAAPADVVCQQRPRPAAAQAAVWCIPVGIGPCTVRAGAADGLVRACAFR